MKELAAGTILDDRYELVELIGEGGMGMVWKAFDRRLERAVAIKVLIPDLQVDSEMVQRFIRESKILARLDHPNVVRFYGAGLFAKQRYYLVTELLTGTSLRVVLNANTAVSFSVAVDYMRQIASGLHHAHEQGIVHRDLKPSNIFVTNSGAVKIIDFGLSSIVTASQRLTQTGDLLGSATYMSPEQCTGEKPAAGMDVYAAGCVFYELLAGTPPFYADTNMGVIYKHMHAEPNIALIHSSSAQDLVRAMLAKSVEDRIPSMSEVASRLEVITDTEPMPVRTDRGLSFKVLLLFSGLSFVLVVCVCINHLYGTTLRLKSQELIFGRAYAVRSAREQLHDLTDFSAATAALRYCETDSPHLPRLQLAEMFLLYASAALRNGNVSASQSYINRALKLLVATPIVQNDEFNKVLKKLDGAVLTAEQLKLLNGLSRKLENESNFDGAAQVEERICSVLVRDKHKVLARLKHVAREARLLWLSGNHEKGSQMLHNDRAAALTSAPEAVAQFCLSELVMKDPSYRPDFESLLPCWRNGNRDLFVQFFELAMAQALAGEYVDSARTMNLIYPDSRGRFRILGAGCLALCSSAQGRYSEAAKILEACRKNEMAGDASESKRFIMKQLAILRGLTEASAEQSKDARAPAFRQAESLQTMQPLREGLCEFYRDSHVFLP